MFGPPRCCFFRGFPESSAYEALLFFEHSACRFPQGLLSPHSRHEKEGLLNLHTRLENGFVSDPFLGLAVY